MVGLISVLRIQRAVSVGNTEESVRLGALWSDQHLYSIVYTSVFSLYLMQCVCVRFF